MASPGLGVQTQRIFSDYIYLFIKWCTDPVGFFNKAWISRALKALAILLQLRCASTVLLPLLLEDFTGFSNGCRMAGVLMEV